MIKTNGTKFILELEKHQLETIWLVLDGAKVEEWKPVIESVRSIVEEIEDWAEYFSLDLEKIKRGLAVKDLPF